jgi:hypothetical protein
MPEFAVVNRLKIACGDVMIWDWQMQAVLVFVNRLDTLDAFPLGKLAKNLRKGMLQAFKSSATSFMEGVVTPRTHYQSRKVDDGVFVRRTRQSQKKDDGDPLFHVLATTLALEQDYNYLLTTDPRDRIFSVLQLASDTSDFRGFPDYTWTRDKVFRETARIMLKQGHIDVLAYCQFPRDSPSLPAWAPDWQVRVLSPCTGPPWTSNLSASANTLSKQQVLSPTPETIMLQGILVDSVEKAGMSGIRIG